MADAGCVAPNAGRVRGNVSDVTANSGRVGGNVAPVGGDFGRFFRSRRLVFNDLGWKPHKQGFNHRHWRTARSVLHFDGVRGKAAETAALQNAGANVTTLAHAKRLGVRQSSGALDKQPIVFLAP